MIFVIISLPFVDWLLYPSLWILPAVFAIGMLGLALGPALTRILLKLEFVAYWLRGKFTRPSQR